jgi:hypothetical protein
MILWNEVFMGKVTLRAFQASTPKQEGQTRRPVNNSNLMERVIVGFVVHPDLPHRGQEVVDGQCLLSAGGRQTACKSREQLTGGKSKTYFS